jgi:hypothetical protein
MQIAKCQEGAKNDGTGKHRVAKSQRQKAVESWPNKASCPL